LADISKFTNTNIRQSMLKLKTQSGFHDLFLKQQLLYISGFGNENIKYLTGFPY
jgi:hypothetical protein